MQNPHNLVWLDLEMTGLNPDQDSILEIATIVTDSELNILAEGPVFAITQPEEVLSAMDDWNQEHHAASGLLERVRRGGVSLSVAQEATLEFLRHYVSERKSPLCGNSICQDRRFLFRHMPRLEAYFHYRNLDVSTIKELALRWAPQVVESYKKQGAHLALVDIRESIEELRHYRHYFFK